MLNEVGGDVTFTTDGGQDFTVPAAVDVPDGELLWILRNVGHFAYWAHLPAELTLGDARLVRDAWCEAQGLPTREGAADTLWSILDRYPAAIEVDFARHYPGIEPADLWRARRWRRLHNLIVRLPRASHYHEAVLNDEDALKAMLENEKDDEEKDDGPPVSEFDLHAEQNREMISLLMSIRGVLIAANSKGGKAPKMVPPPGPKTLLERVRFRVKENKQKALADRYLRRNAQDEAG